jgi:hypothetical protein
MKMIAAALLAGAFLVAQPAFAGVEEAPKTEKAPKAKKEKADKGDKGAKTDDAKKEEPKKDDKKDDKKAGW